MNIHSPLFQTVAHLLIAVMWAYPVHGIAASLQVDQQAGGNTKVTAAQNGVPVVNIATPNSKGLSHNKFNDYNVGQQGLILNNSTNKLAQTQLGGIVFGNSQLNGKAANTILNEVTGGQRSQLKGYTEVAGKQAHVIVANPHGITCDGCGFINTPHATLTTGKPMLENGQVRGYEVDGGDIEIAGGALNASNISRFDLITRSAKINAELHANELNVITGRNQVDADTLKATAKTGQTSEQPLLAIDSSALGGMYARSIRLVGTEAGVGVKLAGDMAANAGDIQIDTNGQLTLSRVAASTDIQLAAADIQLAGDVYAGQRAQLVTPTLSVQGSLAAGEQITVKAGQLVNHGIVEAGVKADGRKNGEGQLNVQADLLINKAQVSSHGGLKIEAQTLDNRQGLIASTREASLQAETLLNEQGSIVSQGDLAVGVQRVLNDSGMLLAENNLVVQAQEVVNEADGLMLAGTDVAVTASETFENAGRLQTGQDLQLEAGKLLNTGSLSAGQNVQVQADELRNDQGLILSGGDMQLTGREVVNRRGSIFSLGNMLIDAEGDVGAGGRVSNLSGLIEASGDLLVRGNHIENIREDFAIRTYKYSARLVHVGCRDCKGTNEDALFRLDEIDRTEVTRNSPQSELLSGGNLSLQAEKIDNWYSLLAAAGNMHLVAGRLENRGAQSGDVFQSRVLHSHRVRAHRVGYQISDANAFTARNWHASSGYNPGNISAELNRFINRHVQGTRSISEPVVSNTEYHHGTIQSGGVLHIEADEQINNSLIRPSFAYVSGGNRADGAIETLVPLSPQYLSDLTQQLPNISELPGNNGLFSLNTSPRHTYLIETNPALTQMQQFLSSDYLLGNLGLSTDSMQKRLGDGFYEQKLIRNALVARTGQRFIAGIHSDEALFRYLMDNAIASKDALSLSVGIGLTAEQVAALTHDIVWMEEREVLGETVLVPVLYMAQTEGRLAPNGALVQGQDLSLISGGDLSNQGTLRASNSFGAQAQNIHNSGLIQAGEGLSLLAEGGISNRQGGILTGHDVDLIARTGDILNERSITRHESALGSSRWEASFADRAARIEAANSLRLNAGRDVQNLGGVLQSGGDMQISAERDVSLVSAKERHGNSRGSHYLNSQTTQLGSETLADGNLLVEAGRNLSVVASRIESGQDMLLYAGHDLTLAAAANESRYYSKSKRHTSQRDLVQQQGSEVVSGGQLSAVAGNDLTLVSSHVNASDEAYLIAGGKLQLLAEQDVDYSFYEKKSKGIFGRKSYRMNESDNSTAAVSSIQAGSDLLVYGAEAIVSQGAQLQAGQHLELQSSGDILLLAAENSSSQASVKSKSRLLSSKGKATSQSQTRLTGTTAKADSLLINAGQDLLLTAGYLRAEQDMVLQAGRDLELSSGLEYSSQSQKKYSSKFGLGHFALPSLTQKQQMAKQGAAIPQGSYLSSGQMHLNAQRNVVVLGSTLVSEGDMSIQSGRHLNILAAEGSAQSQSASSSKKIGSIGQSWLPAVGRVKQEVKTRSDSLQQHSSQLASLGGNISLQAGETYHQATSGLLALDGDINIRAKQVEIEAGHDELSHSETRTTNRITVGGSVSIPVVSAIQNMRTVNRARGRTDDPRLQTLAAATMAMQGKAVYDSAQAPAGGNTSGMKISINLSNSHSKSTTAQAGRNVAASSVIAGGDVHIQASGTEESDINIIGSRVSAGQDITLYADRNIFLGGAQNTAQQNSKGSGGGWSVGVGFGLGSLQNGFTLDLAANQFRGKADGSDVMWSNTQVEAGRRVHMESGADTELQGAVVKGEQVTADIGGHLIVKSLQDRSTYRSRQSSSGAGVSMCIPPFCYGGMSTISANQSNSKATGDYASVNQQSGIQAGDGGFQLTVGGKTELTGAVIASNEQAVQNGLNRLETGTLVLSDLHNHSDYKASSAGLVVSYDFGIGKDNKAIMAEANQGKAFSSDLTGSALSRISGSDSSVTRSGISQAEIVITDLQAQQELTGQTATALLDKLNDAVRSGDSSGGIAKNWDGKNLERVVQANAEIMTAFSQQATYSVNAYVHSKREELLTLQQAEKDEDLKAEIQQSINMLNTQGRAVQILIGAATGQLETAAAHGLLQEAADQMRQYSIESSNTFKGVIIGVNEDGTDKVLSNLSGESVGVRGDGKKLGGVRVDLDLICGTNNQRCVTQEDDNGKPILDSNGIPELKWENDRVKFDEKKAGMDFDKFLTTKEGRKMSGLTGGVQGLEGTIANIPYRSGGFWDHLVESFAGTHDTIGGDITGLYDKQGNTTRELTEVQKTIYDAWSIIAIVPSTPFAVSEALPSEAWQALDILLRGN